MRTRMQQSNTCADSAGPGQSAIRCLLCAIELEGFAEPLCAICRQDNYVILVGSVWHAFSNEGRLHASSNGQLDEDHIICLARVRRRAARMWRR